MRRLTRRGLPARDWVRFLDGFVARSVFFAAPDDLVNRSSLCGHAPVTGDSFCAVEASFKHRESVMKASCDTVFILVFHVKQLEKFLYVGANAAKAGTQYRERTFLFTP
jgi:hypothetical protein